MFASILFENKNVFYSTYTYYEAIKWVKVLDNINYINYLGIQCNFECKYGHKKFKRSKYFKYTHYSK